MDAPYYPCYNSWYPIGSCYSDMCQASLDSMLRMQQSKLNAYTFEEKIGKTIEEYEQEEREALFGKETEEDG